MKFNPAAIPNSKGFSLIEVIIIIIIASVAFTMIFKFFGSFVTDSSIPVHRLSHALELKQVAERITEPYRLDPTKSLSTKHWALNSFPQIYGENFTVIYNEFIKFAGYNDTELSMGDTEDMLKVKIKHNVTNETITLLFVRQ